MSRTRLLGSLVSLLGLGLGCSQAASQPAARPAPRPAAIARSLDAPSVRPPPPVSQAERALFRDTDLASAVRRELDHGADLGVHRVEAQVQDGVATLRGEVGTRAEALHAARLVETIRGLRGLDNQLRVEGPWRNGDVVAWQVANELNREGVVPTAPIRINQGRVVITGEVASLGQKQRVEDAVRGVPGVGAVDNQLEVEPPAPLTDRQIMVTLAQRFSSLWYLEGHPLGVTVSGGTVTLSGGVESLHARRRVVELASFDGVRELEVDALVVSPTRPPLRDRPPAPAENPVNAVSAVRADNGQVVVNRLEVRAQPSLDDRAIERHVASRLGQHPSVAARRVRVSVDRSVATLMGSVDSDFQSACAERAAGHVRGVRRVENHLRLEPSSENLRGDAALQRELEQELWWDARLDEPSSLYIEVRDGTATISGKVADWDQRDAVIENVIQVAPLDFVNRIEVPTALLQSAPTDEDLAY